MIICTKARRGRIPRASIYQLTELRANPTTLAVKINHITCAAWRCNDTARAAFVPRPGGNQQRLCLRHWRQELNRELAEGVRRELARLFRRLRPWVFGLRGDIETLAAIPAPIGAEGRTA